MGLLDQVLGGIMGGSGGNSPLQGALMNMLGGGQQGGVGIAGHGSGMMGGGITGGLGGLISKFEQAGLGHVAQSWAGNGPNQPVSPQQLQSVFGENQVHSMATQAGMQPHDFIPAQSAPAERGQRNDAERSPAERGHRFRVIGSSVDQPWARFAR